MAYLRNRAVNWLNLHSGIRSMAEGMGGAFVLISLLREGVSVAGALCAMALIFAGRFAIRPFILVAATRVGLKPLIIGGNLVIAAQYLVLAQVRGIDSWLLTYCLVSALGDSFYWTSQHAYFALLGDNEHRGHQTSATFALTALVGIVAPLIGAFALVSVGPTAAFALTSLVQTLGAGPLLAIPNVMVPARAQGSFRAALPGVGLFMADGWFAVSYFLLWQIALYLSLRESVSAYGGALAIAAFVGAVSSLLLGRHIDAGHGRRAVAIAYSMVSITLVIRALSLDTPWLAVAANALGAITSGVLGPTQMVPVYNLAKVSPCALRFHIAAEGGWDTGCASGCLLAALCAAHGLPLGAITLLGFLGALGQVVLLRRYYRQLAAW
jgi:hypothetical protein